jgi:hypothetical protein
VVVCSDVRVDEGSWEPPDVWGSLSDVMDVSSGTSVDPDVLAGSFVTEAGSDVSSEVTGAELTPDDTWVDCPGASEVSERVESSLEVSVCSEVSVFFSVLVGSVGFRELKRVLVGVSEAAPVLDRFSGLPNAVVGLLVVIGVSDASVVPKIPLVWVAEPGVSTGSLELAAVPDAWLVSSVTVVGLEEPGVWTESLEVIDVAVTSSSVSMWVVLAALEDKTGPEVLVSASVGFSDETGVSDSSAVPGSELTTLPEPIVVSVGFCVFAGVCVEDNKYGVTEAIDSPESEFSFSERFQEK